VEEGMKTKIKIEVKLHKVFETAKKLYIENDISSNVKLKVDGK